MAEFQVVDSSEVPRPTRQTGRLDARMKEYENYLTSVKKNQVGKLSPSPGESARAVAMRVSRAARRLNRQADTWVVDGIVYFKVV